MSKISYLRTLGFAALYVVTIFMTAFLGFFAPWAWVFFPVVAALIGALSYYCTAIRWQKFGVGTLLAVALAAGSWRVRPVKSPTDAVGWRVV